MPIICKEEGCNKSASYALTFEKPLYCKEHKTEKTKFHYRICICGSASPIFGNENDIRPSCCKKCKEPEMRDIKNKMCIKCKKTRPIFGLNIKKAPTHCETCKTEEMIDIGNSKKKCPCGTRATFGLKKDKKAVCCVSCKLDEMIDVYAKGCMCGKIDNPTFGFANETPICCASCRTDKMIDVYARKCICGKVNNPTFGLLTDDRPTCCFSCKSDNMTTINKRKCTHCNLREPRFGYLNDKIPTHCSTCKNSNMVNFYDCCCLTCGINANFGYEGDKVPTYCNICKKDGMDNIKIKKCKANEQNILCDFWSNPKYKGYCTHCFAHLFPNDPLTFQIRCKTKEIAVRDYINATFDGFAHDKALWISGCKCTHRRRIDHRKLIGNTLLCIETDENQHKYYKENDEKIRYDDVMMIHGGKFIFIRFNPDKYKENNVVKNPTISTRLTELEKEINKQIERIDKEENTELVEIVKLYYDK